MDNPNWKNKVGRFGNNLKVQIGNLFHIVKENKNIALIVVLFCITVFAGIIALNKTETRAEVAATAEAQTTTVSEEEEIAVPEEALEKDAYPEVNNLIKQYFQALVDGDIDTIHKIKNHTNEEEELKILKKSEFIESYPSITVYTKKGPEEGSHIAYVHYEVKFYDYETTAPGLNTLYICTDENGNYYINANELDESVVEYLKTVSLQNDILDLFNTVQVAYNEVKTNETGLSAFLDELPNLLAESVSEALAEQVALKEAENAEAEEVPEEIVVVTKVKTTDVVNVRSSDSIEADRVGKTTVGQVLELVEEKVNGWSKVVFDGKEGYIKSEFLETEETQVVANPEASEEASVEEETAAKEEASQEEESEQSTITKGKVTDTVNVRKTPSTSGDKVGKLAAGASIDIIEKQSDGWTKIKYNDSEAYVKSDYVE